jgi:hypothetical protein
VWEQIHGPGHGQSAPMDGAVSLIAAFRGRLGGRKKQPVRQMMQRWLLKSGVDQRMTYMSPRTCDPRWCERWGTQKSIPPPPAGGAGMGRWCWNDSCTSREGGEKAARFWRRLRQIVEKMEPMPSFLLPVAHTHALGCNGMGRRPVCRRVVCGCVLSRLFPRRMFRCVRLASFSAKTPG